MKTVMKKNTQSIQRKNHMVNDQASLGDKQQMPKLIHV